MYGDSDPMLTTADSVPVLPPLVVAVCDVAVGLGQVLGGHLDSTPAAWWGGWISLPCFNFYGWWRLVAISWWLVGNM